MDTKEIKEKIEETKNALISYIMERIKNTTREELSELKVSDLLKMARQLLIWDLAKRDYERLDERDIIQHFANEYDDWDDIALFIRAKEEDIIDIDEEILKALL